MTNFRLKCGACRSDAAGRASDAFLTSIGWRKINGKWTCPACTGLLFTRLEGPNPTQRPQDGGNQE